MYTDTKLVKLYNRVCRLTVNALEYRITSDEYNIAVRKVIDDMAQYIGTDAAKEYALDAMVEAENAWADTF